MERNLEMTDDLAQPVENRIFGSTVKRPFQLVRPLAEKDVLFRFILRSVDDIVRYAAKRIDGLDRFALRLRENQKREIKIALPIPGFSEAPIIAIDLGDRNRLLLDDSLVSLSEFIQK